MTLLTGGTGFVGGHVVRALRDAGEKVRCLVRDPGRASELERLGCELVQGDMTEPDTLRGAVDGVESVVHLVAIRQGKRSQFEAVMSRGTRALLDAARDAGVRRFVHMSALGTTEETKDIVPYYRAKWDMEQAVQASGLPYVIFRPSFVFAPDGGILPTFRKLARLMPVTPIVGSGEQRLQPIWADDLACVLREGTRGRRSDEPHVRARRPRRRHLERALGATQAGARGSAAQHPRADEPDARERARDRAPPRQQSRSPATS